MTGRTNFDHSRRLWAGEWDATPEIYSTAGNGKCLWWSIAMGRYNMTICCANRELTFVYLPRIVLQFYYWSGAKTGWQCWENLWNTNSLEYEGLMHSTSRQYCARNLISSHNQNVEWGLRTKLKPAQVQRTLQCYQWIFYNMRQITVHMSVCRNWNVEIETDLKKKNHS